MFLEIASFVSFFVFLRYLRWNTWAKFQNLFLKNIVQSHCTYYKSSLIEKNLKAFNDINVEDNSTWKSKSSDILSLIDWNNINLRATCVGDETKSVYQFLAANQSEFFINQIDNLTFIKMGVNVITIHFGDRGNDRSLQVNISSIQNEIYSYFSYINIFLSIVGTILVQYLNQKTFV